MSDIILQKITKRYDEKLVLDSFSYQFSHGQRYCIMGSSGSGKTTLLHILMGLEPINAGTIAGLAHLAISPVFQEDRLCENLSVRSNLNLVSEIPQKDTALLHALTSLELGDVLHQPIKNLSGGMKRRVAILRALLSAGELTIMDEPFKGLDEKTKEKTMEYVHQKTIGKTMIWVTHDSSELAFLPSTVIAL